MYFTVLEAEFRNFRGLQGTVRFGKGLNLILGPNSAGKTTLLEAVAFSLIPHLSEVAEFADFLMMMEASRGSVRHSFSSMISGEDAEACLKMNTLSDAKKICINLTKKEYLISIPGEYEGVMKRVEVIVESSNGNSIQFIFDKRGYGFRVKHSKRGLSGGIAVIPSGVLPYNRTEARIGTLKRKNPDILQKFIISIGDKKYSIDLATDEWDEALVMVVEKDKLYPFYSIGKGLQRAFQIMIFGALYDLLLIDEIESSMHPELLAHISLYITELAKERQIIVTTQSLEASMFLASAALGLKPTTDREHILEKLEETAEEPLFNLIIIDTYDGRMKSATLSGKSAIRKLVGMDDVRLSYKFLR
ncbi:hypothetical protein IPA_06550 [Ignicoccus pacificus DSM 13166]|uniref:AAA+ ATPase domain-containing protein n=1 Tax=Ignicoccus pacificus DSM 13166 TaxID=940294 RepID=A0A977KBG5_9CREN|nr:hypothetical protein IPA_06550 [Ignicoccus pacificus DSM 13166]